LAAALADLRVACSLGYGFEQEFLIRMVATIEFANEMRSNDLRTNREVNPRLFAFLSVFTKRDCLQGLPMFCQRRIFEEVLK
jgi:hypothetical protein